MFKLLLLRCASANYVTAVSCRCHVHWKLKAVSCHWHVLQLINSHLSWNADISHHDILILAMCTSMVSQPCLVPQLRKLDGFSNKFQFLICCTCTICIIYLLQPMQLLIVPHARSIPSNQRGKYQISHHHRSWLRQPHKFAFCLSLISWNKLQNLISSGCFTWSCLLKLLVAEIFRRAIKTAIDSFV